MIVVKLKQTLRIGNKVIGKRLIPSGSVFRAEQYEDFPEWLRDEIKYFNDNIACDTLLIKEMSLKVQGIASKGKVSDDSKTDKKKTVKKKNKSNTKPKKSGSPTLQKRKK